LPNILSITSSKPVPRSQNQNHKRNKTSLGFAARSGQSFPRILEYEKQTMMHDNE